MNTPLVIEARLRKTFRRYIPFGSPKLSSLLEGRLQCGPWISNGPDSAGPSNALELAPGLFSPMPRIAFKKTAPLLSVLLLLVGGCSPPPRSAQAVESSKQDSPAQTQAAGNLESRFLNPPADTRPWVYWFWMNGNVTKEGITADLEAMNRVGVGGALMMGVGLATPAGDADFNSPAWHELYAHAAKECVRLGMKLSLHQCDGWATAGGQWITPDRSMKKLVWTSTGISGPHDKPLQLPKPEVKEDFYEEVAVLAVPTDADKPVKPAQALVDGKPAPELTDGDPATGAKLPADAIELVFEKPQQVASIVFHLPKIQYGMGHGMPSSVEISADGKSFHPAAGFDLNVSLGDAPSQTLTVSFPPENAAAVRVRVKNPNAAGEIAGIETFGEPRVHLWEVKSGFAREREHGGETKWIDPASEPAEAVGIPKDSVIDLTGKMAADGTLDWKAPQGTWQILRIGMTSTAKHVAPRTNAGEGLEADKMSGEAIRFHWDSFAKKMIAANNVAPGNPIYSVHTDSWESNIHTWSNWFQKEFEKRRGYAMTPWLAVLTTGRIVGTAEESERFLWDVRRTMSDLIADNFYGEMLRLCHESQVLFQSEAAGRQMFMYDPLNYAANTDIYVGEFWMPAEVRPDCKLAASAAHIYDRPIAGAESFTAGQGGFREAPFDFKALGDHAFATGINRFIIHRYAMQPYIGIEPGMCFGPYGINFDRTNTWWENGGKAWVDYLTRCQSMLQSGKFVGDVMYYIGDGAPNFLGHRDRIWNPVPPGYDFDGCNFEILNRLTVADNGDVVLPHGARYRVLLLPDRKQMTLPAIQAVERLVEAGATAIGPKPLRTPGLKDWQEKDAELCKIADKLWGKIDGTSVTENHMGKGRVISGISLAEVLAGITPPDFEYSSTGGAKLRYIHRRDGNADIYFVANADSKASVDSVVRFRTTGKAPEFWDPSTGSIVHPAVYRQDKDITEVPLHLDPAGSVFVVFREPASPDTIAALNRDGTPVFPAPATKPTVESAPAAADPSAIGSFTMSVWIKPGTPLNLPEQGLRGVSPAGMNYAIYPVPGHEVFADGAAGIGLAAGTNGVVVLAHAARLFAPLLAHSADLSGWTHVAVVVNDGVPTLFLNGKEVASGVKCPVAARPSIGVQHTRRVPAFQGETAAVAGFAKPLDGASISGLMGAPPQTRTVPAPQFARANGGLRVLSGEAGDYSATTASGKKSELVVSPAATIKEITGPWNLSFPPGRGAPEKAVFPKLVSWPDSEDPGIKYFSGTATYATAFQVDKVSDRQVVLDLGDVKNIAEVSLNGKNLGILWKPPYSVDVTGALKAGENILEVKVTNLWPNRLIGDEKLFPDPALNYSKQMPPWAAGGPIKTIPDWVKTKGKSPVGRSTFLLWKFYGGEEDLLPSGLLGPVNLRSAGTVVGN